MRHAHVRWISMWMCVDERLFGGMVSVCGAVDSQSYRENFRMNIASRQ